MACETPRRPVTLHFDTKPGVKRPRLRLTINQDHVDINDKMLDANRALSRGQPEAAIELYTQVLYDLSPGHVCAFLNRSLCYVWMGYYELAAADAYRAALATHGMRSTEFKYLDSRLIDQQRYLRAEAHCVNTKESWTSEQGRYIGQGWADSPLASLVINDGPDANKLALSEEAKKKMNLRKFQPNQRQELCSALEIRAIYRLASALYLCGGGARANALGLIDDAINQLDILEWERFYMLELGDEIMLDTIREVEIGKRLPRPMEVSQEWLSEDRTQRLQKITQNMSGRYVQVRWRDAYSKWNTNEPNYLTMNWNNILQNYVAGCTEKCTPVTESYITPAGDLVSAMVMVASQNIYTGDVIIAERSILNVNTNVPGIISDSSVTEDVCFKFCSACSSLMTIPTKHEVQYLKKQQGVNPSEQERPCNEGSPATKKLLLRPR